MADDGNEGGGRERLIAQIRELQDELRNLRVPRQSIRLSNFKTDADLAQLLESFEEQLQQRKKFLGVKQ